MADTKYEIVERLKKYRPPNNWGDRSHHTICDEAASTIASLAAALEPFYAAYKKKDSDIPDSDLDNEQPKHVTVTLGDLRRARSALYMLKKDSGS